MQKAKEWIEKLNLQRHPEGGWFIETYRSNETLNTGALPKRFSEDHVFATSIYFLLEADDFSAFHRINQDETWHFYDGSPILLHIISPESEYTQITIGCEPERDILPQYTVPAGHLFAAEVKKGCDFALVGCTVAPGFLFSDFEMPARQQLLNNHPLHSEIINRLTH